MTRWLSFALLVLFAPTLTAAEIAYEAPAVPPPPDPMQLLVRLVGLTFLTLAVCGGLIWFFRKASRPAAGPTNGRLVEESRLALNGRTSLHILKADGQSIAVTTDMTGIRSIVVLQEPFDDLLSDVA